MHDHTIEAIEQAAKSLVPGAYISTAREDIDSDSAFAGICITTNPPTVEAHAESGLPAVVTVDMELASYADDDDGLDGFLGIPAALTADAMTAAAADLPFPLNALIVVSVESTGGGRVVTEAGRHVTTLTLQVRCFPILTQEH